MPSPPNDPEAASSAEEAGVLTSRLVLGPGSWRQLTAQLVGIVWSVGAAIGVWLGWWVLRDEGAALLVALIVTAWCAYCLWSYVGSLRRSLAMLRSRFPTLVLDDLGVRVRHPLGDLHGAYLAWVDCVAVVASRPPTKGYGSLSYAAYVEFVPVSPDRVESGEPRTDDRTQVLARSAAEVRTVWMEITGVGLRAEDVVAWIRTRRPDQRVLGSLAKAAHSASTE